MSTQAASATVIAALARGVVVLEEVPTTTASMPLGVVTAIDPLNHLVVPLVCGFFVYITTNMSDFIPRS
jgi:hypothetical protein